MPTYEYHCDACGRDFEVKQRISADPLKTHDVCGGGPVRRLLSAAPFILKGAGWYVTDYPSASRKKALESEKSGDKTSPSTDKPAAEKSTTAEKSTASSDGASTSAPSSTSGSSAAASD